MHLHTHSIVRYLPLLLVGVRYHLLFHECDFSFILCTCTKVIEWSTHHKDDPPPPEDDENKEKRTDDIEPWDQEFLKVDQGTLFELILVGMS